MSLISKILTEEYSIEVLTIVALIFGIISLALSSRSHDLTKKSMSNDPGETQQIRDLDTASLAFKVFDIFIVIIVICVNFDIIKKFI